MSAEFGTYCPTCRMADWRGPLNDVYTAEQARRAAEHPHPNGAGDPAEPVPFPGTWVPAPGDALHACPFAKAGFRAYSLSDPGGQWRLVLSRVDPGEREPKGILTVYAPKHERAFGDMAGYVMARSVGLFGGANHRAIVTDLKDRLGGDAEGWSRRLDYLIARALVEIQATTGGTAVISGRPDRPRAMPQAFAGILPVGRSISLYGPGSSGKTTIADGLAVSLCSAVEIIPGWVPTRRFVVGLLDWDEGEEEERARLHAICNAYAVDLGAFHYRRMSRPLAEAADEVGRWTAENGIEVILVSPVNRALRAANGDPGAPVFELYEVLREFGTTNVLVDHVTGANVDNPDAAREYGSVAKRDAARGSFSVYAQSEEPGRRVVVIRNQKPLAMYPRRAPQAVRIEFDPPYPDADGLYDAIRFDADVVEDRSTAPSALHETQPEKMARVLREFGPMDPTQLCAVSGLSASRLRDIARRTREAGYHVRFDAEAGQYVLDMPAEDAE